MATHRRRARLSRSRWGDLLLFLFLGVFGVFMGLPLLYSLVTAFKPVQELFLFPPRFFVRNPTLDNFTTLFNLVSDLQVPFSRYLFNNLFLSVVGTAGYIAVASMAAYPLAKYRSKWLDAYFLVVVWAILFRPEVTSIPQYLVVAKLSLVNTYLALLLPAMAGTFGVFLMRQFMVAFPDEILEAAHIDGAHEMRVLWRVVMPSVRPAWLTLAIFTFQQLWNTTGIQYIYDENLKMLPTVLRQVAAAGMARAGASAVVALFLMIPPVLVFVISQSSVVETMAHAGIKS